MRDIMLGFFITLCFILAFYLWQAVGEIIELKEANRIALEQLSEANLAAYKAELALTKRRKR